MAEKISQPSPYPEPKPILNSIAQNLLNSTTYETDGFLFSFYKCWPPLEKPNKTNHPKRVQFYILDTNL